MKDMRWIAAALMSASILIGICSCDKKAEETTEEISKVEETTSEEVIIEETEATEESSEETSEETSKDEYTGEEYQAFIDDLTAVLSAGDAGDSYYGPGVPDNGDTSTAMYLGLIRDGFSYIFTDVNNDGQHELLIGEEATDLQTGEPIIRVNAFVVVSPEGGYTIAATSWDRNRTSYIGNGTFTSGGSMGASHSVSFFERFDAASCSMVYDTTFYRDFPETDPSEVPGDPYYTLYEDGARWDTDKYDFPCDDPDALHGDEALSRWEEIQASAAASGNELLGQTWITVTIE